MSKNAMISTTGGLLPAAAESGFNGEMAAGGVVQRHIALEMVSRLASAFARSIVCGSVLASCLATSRNRILSSRVL